jgi:PEP-CTERM motif
MRSFFAAAALVASFASTATAQVTVSSANGAPDPGLAPGQTNILNFTDCAAAPAGIVITGGACKTSSSSGNWAQPAQSLTGGGYYTTTSPYPNSTVVIDFSGWLSNNSYNKVLSVSLYWGSVDSYQQLQVLDGSNNVLSTIMGSSLPPANGNQTAQTTNRRVFLDFGGSVRDDFRKLKFVSNQAAFEFDDVAVSAVSRSTVPEPNSVPLLAGALGVLGLFGARRKHIANKKV